MNRTAEERPDDGRKTVLIVEDDPGTQRVLASGLATSLGMFDVLTANHGQEAVELIESHRVDVVVTDLAMPVMDGFALIGYLTNRASTMPVVVLSALAPTTVAEGLDGYGGLTVLRKPTGYPEVARAVLEALERHDLGQVAGIPLASVLQLVEAERRTCSLTVTSGRRRGRLHFESGRLINAFSDDFGAEGEAAAYDVLTWSRTAIEFERLPEGVRRTIDVTTQTLLIEVARRQDEQREREAKLTPPIPLPRTPNGASAAPNLGVVPVFAPDRRADPGAPAGATEAFPADQPQSEHESDPESEHDDAASETDLDHDGAASEAASDAPWEPPLRDVARDGARGMAPTSEPEPEAEAEAEPEPEAAPVPAAADPSEPAPDPSPTTEGAPAPAPAAAPGPDVARAGAPTAVRPTPHDAPPPPPPPGAEPHAALVAAIERLTQRVQAADAALAAVADEVDAFQTAQQRYDEEVRLQEERRHAVEAARRDVADLARQILARMDGLFEVFDAEPAERPSEAHATPAPKDA